MKTENIKMSSKQRGNGDLLFNGYNFNFKMKMIIRILNIEFLLMHKVFVLTPQWPLDKL